MIENRNSPPIKWALIAIIIIQNQPWFLWGSSYLYLGFAVLLLLCLCANRIAKEHSLYARHIPILLTLFGFFVVYSSYQELRISSITTLAMFFILFLISDAEKISALEGLTKTLSIIVSISLGAQVVNELVFELPFEYLQYDSGKGDNGQVIFKNHYLFIQPIGFSSARFYSIFDEPGTLGTLLAFVLFANNYNLRNKNNIALLAGGVLTFSLAFFIITLIGYIIRKSKNALTTIKAATILLAFLIAIGILMDKNEGFQTILIERALNISENGVNSRTSTALSLLFNELLFSPDIILGMGTSFLQDNPALFSGQNYKLFIIEYGLLGFLLTVLMYLSMASRDLKAGYFCLFIFLVSFLQRPFIFTPWQVTLFSLTFTSLYLFRHKQAAHAKLSHKPNNCLLYLPATIIGSHKTSRPQPTRNITHNTADRRKGLN